MADILTDPTATFVAEPVWAATKTNTTPRLPTEANVWIIAQWANEVDTALREVNSFYQGASAAGTATTTAQLLGSLSVAESVTAALGLTVGAVANASTNAVIRGSTTSTCSLMFEDTAADRGGLKYNNTTDELSVWSVGASRLEIDALGTRPTAHNTSNLGSPSRRWLDVHATSMNATSTMVVGGQNTLADLVIDGSAVLNFEPLLSFHVNGVLTSRVYVPPAGGLKFSTTGAVDMSSIGGGLGIPSMDSADRVALTGSDGLTVFDTDLSALMFYSGAAWSTIETAGSTDITFDSDCAVGDLVGACVYVTGPAVLGRPQVLTCDITNAANMPAWGVITSKPTGTTAVVQVLGNVTTVAGLTPGLPVWISAAGAPTTTKPVPGLGITYYLQAIGIAHDSSAFVVNPSAVTIAITG